MTCGSAEAQLQDCASPKRCLGRNLFTGHEVPGDFLVEGRNPKRAEAPLSHYCWWLTPLF